MLKKTLYIAAFMAVLPLASFTQNIIYVKKGGEGIGSSWANATGDLQYAISKAVAGTEIWMAEGNYTPVKCTSCSEHDRSVSFRIPDGVKVYGGFKGGEHRLAKRDWRKHPTTLSGKIGKPGKKDNSFTVVYFENVTAETVLDGLIISDGYANGAAPAGHPSRSGGGMYNNGSGAGNRSVPALKNCLFLNNYALEGGAVFNQGEYGVSSPEFNECAFTSNSAYYGGGAIFNNGERGESNPYVHYCQFVNNWATFGAGIFTACPNNDFDPNFLNCNFVNNKAKNGGGLFFLGLSECPKMRTSRFVNNQSNDDEDIYVMKGKTAPIGLLAEVLPVGTGAL